MENNFQLIFQDYLSPDNNIRVQAENKINEIISKDDPNNLDILYYNLSNNNTNNQIKLFIALLLKKIFDKIQDKNLNNYRNYIRNKKNYIINVILNSNNDIKTTNILVLSLSKAIEIFKTNDYQTEHIQIFIEVLSLIFKFYNENKIINNNYSKAFLSLFVIFKFLKYIQLNLSELTESFYQLGDIIINDFSKIVESLFKSTDNNSIEIFLEYIILYLKMSKYFINTIKEDQSEKIMNIVYDLITQILTVLVQVNDNSNIKISITSSKFMFDIIFLSNKILLKYMSIIDNVGLNIIKKYVQLFYFYVKDENIFQKICSMLKNNNHQYTSKSNNDYKQTKFTVDIIDFFRECVQITTYSNFDELIYFKGIFSDNSINISDFLNIEFFSENTIKQIILFTIKYSLTFKLSEFEMGKNNPEEFYVWYKSLTTFYDLREKGSALIRVIYLKYKKEIRSFFEILENELLNLINKEMNGINKGENLNIDEINLKCALLTCFESISSYYFNKKVDYNKWLNQILLNQLNINYLNVKGVEYFSKFIVVRILNIFFDFKEVEKYKNEIFSTIFNLFNKINIHTYQIILSFVSIDFFFNYFDELNNVEEIPKDFLLNYIQKICEILQVTSNPEIHSKVIKVTNHILEKYNDTEINLSFPIIFPKLTQLWYNNWSEYNQTLDNLQNITITTLHSKYTNKNYNKENKVYNEIAIVRQNLIKLISLFVKKIGIFVNFNNNNNINNEYFNFIYNLIGYSINIKSSESSFLINEGFNLIFIIIDEFFDSSSLSTVQSFSNLKIPIENSTYFPLFFKMFDYIKIILDNLYYSQEYMISQLFLLEEFFSFSFIPGVGIFFDNENFINKIIYLLDNIIGNYIFQYHQIIINFMEYILIIVNYYSKIKQENKDIYNNFIYQYILKIFEKIPENQIKNIIQSKLLLQNENDYNKIIEENNELTLFICGIQLSNTLIKINYLKNEDLMKFLENLSSKILCLYDYLQNENIFLNCLQKDIILETTKNISKMSINDNYSNINNLKIKSIKQKESVYISKYDQALSNHLFFFNKIFNKNFYYNLSLEEDDLRKIWNTKCENIIPLNTINYKIKFYFILLN